MKRKTTPPKKAEAGILTLILVAIALTAVGSLLADARGIPYDSFGGLVWLAALAVSFTFGLLFFAQYALPLGGPEGWGEGLRLLWRHYNLLGEQYLNNLFGPKPKTQPKSRRAGKNRPKANGRELPASFAALRAGNLDSHQVLALAKSNSFARPAGPGFVILYKKEKITHLIDLRKHLRRQPIKASSRDGIPLETNVTVIFRVRQEPAELLEEEPYPYEKEAIFHICHAHSIDAQDAVRGWMEQIAPRAAAMLINELSRYTLDDLSHPGSGGVSVLDQIKADIKRQLGRQLDPNGIEILAVGVDMLTLPEAVVSQRIRTWQSEWKRKITLQQAAGDAEAVRRIKQARARAQIEIIENITQNIASVRQTDSADLSSIITLRMIEALEEAESSSSLQTLIPQQVMANLTLGTSKQLKDLLNESEEEQL
ncbi:MAG: hypothetical protein GY803_25955 [Chloroflexi bacterium]|nr:hypothetical protein [Chloroflexota bacterium]